MHKKQCLDAMIMFYTVSLLANVTRGIPKLYSVLEENIRFKLILNIISYVILNEGFVATWRNSH